MDLNLRGRTVIVTGGSSGLGLACAQGLAAEGCNIVLAARDQTRLQAAALTMGPTVLPLVADIADENSAERLVAAAIARFGGLDGAVVSVGGPAPGTGLSLTDADWRGAFETIFLGAVRMVRALASALSTPPGALSGQGAAITLVLSTSARSPISGLTLSNGLRPGLAMLVKDLAEELGARGIRINALMPGRIATDRTYTLDARAGSPDAVRRRNEASIPLSRYGEPEEFAAVSTFLMSPAASYVTGSLVAVDGGALRAL